MTQAHLQSIFFAELDESDGPRDPAHFGMNGMAFIGSDPDGPADAFDFFACTPSWLAEHLQPGPSPMPPDGTGPTWSGTVLFGSGLVIVQRWSREDLEEAIRRLYETQEGPDWGAVASRIGRVLPWEYAYRYDRYVDQGGEGPFPPEP